jgi:hypothetical protein
MKKLLVNGCSFTQWNESWPSQLTGVDVTNLACRGAGIDYIHDSTIAELSQRRYDFVAIMWTGFWRFDTQVSSAAIVDSFYTSNYQKTYCATPELINDNWMFSCGHIDEDTAIVGSKLFDRTYAMQENPQWLHRTLIKMITLQHTLKQLTIPYLFMYFNDYEKDLTTIPHLYGMLDQANIFNDQNINTIARQNKWLDADMNHPGPLAHKYWANLIQPRITK